MNILIFLAIGAIAGYLAGLILRGGGLGLVLNLVVGVLGSIIGGYLFGILGLSPTSNLGLLISCTTGAVAQEEIDQ